MTTEAIVSYLGCFPRRCIDTRCRAPHCLESAGCFCAILFRGEEITVALCLPHGRAADAKIRGLLDGKSREKAVCLLGMVTGEAHRKAMKSVRSRSVGKRFSEYGDPVLPRGRYVGYG